MAVHSLQDIIGLHQAGKLDEAETGYRALLDDDTDNADAIHLLGVICFQRGKYAEARDLVQRAIALNGFDPLYFANLGRIEKAAGAIHDAISAYRQSLSINPNQADVHSDLAASLVEINEFSEARKCAEHALNLAPEYAPAALNLGLALVGEGDDEAAVDAFSKAVRLDSGQVEGWFQLAQIYHEQSRQSDAEQSYNAVLNLEPNHIEALCNLGNLHRMGGNLEQATVLYDKVLSLSPERAEVISNKGVALQELGRRDDAIVCYRRAIELSPNDAETHRNLSMALLQGDEFDEGWSEFEWRWQTGHFAHIHRDWDKPLWSGEPLAGKTILVHAEQGFGDSFQFCRYIPMLAAQGPRVIVEAPDVIHTVIETIGGIDNLITPGQTLPEFDFHIPMMSLPRAFKTDIHSIPSPSSYLSAPAFAAKKWYGKLGGLDGRKVGVVWKGNSIHSRNLWRSPGIDVLRPLFELDGCAFVSLQKDDGRKDLRQAGLLDKIMDLEADLETYADTAAVIDQLDLVITPDTSVAHLSGALGCETWLMLPYIAEWRWGIEREDCPWYSSVRLFRQPAQGDWSSVIEKIMGELN